MKCKFLNKQGGCDKKPGGCCKEWNDYFNKHPEKGISHYCSNVEGVTPITYTTYKAFENTVFIKDEDVEETIKGLSKLPHVTNIKKVEEELWIII